MDVVFDWNLGNMIYNGHNTLRLRGFLFAGIWSFQVVLTISHLVNLIRGLVIEVCDMKLCKDILIPVILETHVV